jgi:hypothetical protein
VTADNVLRIVLALLAVAWGTWVLTGQTAALEARNRQRLAELADDDIEEAAALPPIADCDRVPPLPGGVR